MANGYSLSGFVAGLNDSTGRLVGLLGADGREYLINAQLNTAAQAAPSSCFFTNLVNTFTASQIFASVRISGFLAALADGSGTPGNVTQNVTHGRAAFATATNTVVVSNSLVLANSTVLISLGGSDATLTTVRVTPAAGSFTVTGNAAATGITPFDYFVVQN